VASASAIRPENPLKAEADVIDYESQNPLLNPLFGITNLKKCDETFSRCLIYPSAPDRVYVINTKYHGL
jgi:hypothetical protein